MQNILSEKLWGYIFRNNPDMIFSLQEGRSVIKYLKEKVSPVMSMAAEPIAERLRSRICL